MVMVADAVMSLDNVIAVAAAAKGSLLLLVLGITISIPPVVLGSAVMLYVLDRFPILVIAGSGLLGWVAGELAVEDETARAAPADGEVAVSDLGDDELAGRAGKRLVFRIAGLVGDVAHHDSRDGPAAHDVNRECAEQDQQERNK